ncbi:MAG: response regulator transcription factor [Lachnospiraceae bacterium]|jgi:DNA-binding LytR/AlgR family response regulator|nr:response regulator transcription factor [Lachnospiraceae bacterium]
MDIAICDDEQKVREYLSRLIQKQMREQGIEYCITEYASAGEYMEENRRFDLLFLDIELKHADMDGMTLARKLYEYSHQRPIIIFVTGFEDYVYDAFDVNAFQYLLKPVDEEKFEEVLRRAVKTVKQEERIYKEKETKTICIQFSGNTKIVAVDTISHIESYHHKLILHTVEGEIEYYARLSDLERELSDSFYRIHKSYLVNFSYVDTYNKTEMCLLDGTKLWISKYRYAEFVKAYMRYMKRVNEYE